MIESNLVNLKQGIGLLGASKKLQKGNTGKEHGQLMPFACIMGHACRIATQKTKKVLLDFSPGKGKQNNILGAGKDKTEKTNQSLPVKGKGLAENPHGVILKGGTTKDINLFITNRSFSGKINSQSESGGQKQIGTGKDEGEGQKVKMAAAVKGKSAVEPAITEKNSFTPVNSGGKNNIGNLLKPLGLKGEAKAVVGKNEAQVRVGPPEPFGGLIGPFGKRALDSGIRNGKNDTALFKDGKNVAALFKDGKTDAALFKNGKNIAGINNALLRPARRQSGGGHRTEGNGRKAKMEEKQGLLKFNLKNAAAVKGKSAVEPAITEKNSFTPVNSGGKNNIGNLLKPLGLNAEDTIKIPHRGTPQPESPSVRGFSAGGHNNTTFHVSGSSATVNESVNSHAIEPRVLINQIASGVKRPGRVRITLNPPRLGTLDVDVLVRNNKVHVILQTENNDVRQILHSNVESLKSSLRNHGLVADTINVSVQDKSDGANHGADYRSEQNETLFREGKNREGNEEDQSGEQDSLNHDPSSLEEENQGVRSDGRISLFA